MQRYIEKYLLPIAMVVGISFHSSISILAPATPYLLAVMLFFTYARISWRDIRMTQFHYILLAIQYIGSALVYAIVRPFNEILAQAAMICILAPTATSAPVVSGILGGSVSATAAYSIMSNLSVAFIAPVYLSIIGHTGQSVPFLTAFGYIFLKVMPTLILPFLLALALERISPAVHKKIRSAQIVSFYVWAVALTIVIANVTNFVITEFDGNFRLEILIAIVAAIICLLQFFLGRKIGNRHHMTIAGGQGMGQKNTILAIWLTQTYLNPIASLGPGMYVIWQNVVNSWQIWKKKRAEEINQTE
ncbi:MAG: transporter [Dysgonomonadaceae bacterium]|jgi:BASS family bile acid:Na+ symporter|nr:transporter [Dysgonamonadaceae bacterium]HOT65539.1 transporter [Dysgonamonadaceae bacterium]HOV36920.1 transporter [Dysgonamonadaceae bacterium]HQG07785.1 transporter [Dysgonamonadaceae bacterium]HQI43310.1 transporter [Dysgonamonadaceae bacterium]